MGIKHIIVCVTKMDLAKFPWAQSTFTSMQQKLTTHLNRISYNPLETHFIPISTATGPFHSHASAHSQKLVADSSLWGEGDNIFAKSTNMGWYTGPTLADALQSMAMQQALSAVRLRSLSKPSRFVVQRIYSGSYKQEQQELIVGGALLSGTLSIGDPVVIQPSNIACVTVKSIESHHRPRYRAFAPYDSVALKLQWTSPVSVASVAGTPVQLGLLDVVKRGSVIGKRGRNQPQRVKSAQATVSIVEHPSFIKTGYTPTVRVHSANVRCSMQFLKQVLSLLFKVLILHTVWVDRQGHQSSAGACRTATVCPQRRQMRRSTHSPRGKCRSHCCSGPPLLRRS